MSTTITVAAADLFRAADILFAGFKADHNSAGHKRAGLPVTVWSVPGGVELGTQLTGGSVSVVVPATVEGDDLDEFTFALAAIRDNKGSLGKGSVALKLDGPRFRVEAAGATVEAATVDWQARRPDRSDLPIGAPRAAEFVVDCAALPYVAAALADDDARPVLTMVHCEATRPGSDRVTLIGADGFRIHEAAVPATVQRWDGCITERPADTYVSLPGWLVAAVVKLAAPCVAVQAAWLEDHERKCGAHAAHGGLSLVASWQPSGAAPDFRKITSGVPDDAEPCVGKMAELVAALTALKPVARQSANIFRVTPEDGALMLESTAKGVGTVRRRVATTGPGLMFGANVTLWLDALGKPNNGAGFGITFDERMVKAAGFSSPIRLTTEQPFGEAKAIIMPMHIAR